MDSILSDSLDDSASHASPLQNHAPLSEKLKALEHSEVCDLLEQYFRQVVELRTAEGAGQRARQELEVRLAEEVEARRKSEVMLGQVQLEGERALLTQQLVSHVLGTSHSILYREVVLVSEVIFYTYCISYK